MLRFFNFLFSLEKSFSGEVSVICNKKEDGKREGAWTTLPLEGLIYVLDDQSSIRTGTNMFCPVCQRVSEMSSQG
jgi:hypothetical protein